MVGGVPASSHPETTTPISQLAGTHRPRWRHLPDIKTTYSKSVDYVEGYLVFNIKGNNYRLIAQINYRVKIVKINDILTHADYDRGNWKK
jgi:mRNA interferase HigB